VQIVVFVSRHMFFDAVARESESEREREGGKER
jgi:hypothetical protein